jgi:hypothetical protein
MGPRSLLHPGAVEDPVRAVETILNLADAVDDIARERSGFDCLDLLTVAATVLRVQHTAFAGAWHAAPDPQL